jgi:hypothetical protein
MGSSSSIPLPPDLCRPIPAKSLREVQFPIAAWSEIRPLIQTLRLAVENHRA